MTSQTESNSTFTADGIRTATSADAGTIASIYNAYIAHSIATFEVDPVSASEMEDRIRVVQNRYPWLVTVKNNIVIGYAYATTWKARAAYDRTVETTIYIHPDHLHQGVGLPLYQELLRQLVIQGCHAAIGGIALPNPGSVQLHERLGFEKVAQFREVGYKFGQWVDVGYWEIIL